jgi:SAM-dependent methyltransferase
MAAPDQTTKFNAQGYWEERLRAHPGVRGVGHLGLSLHATEQQYRRRMRQIDVGLRRHGLSDLRGRAVLDVGAGTGIWLEFWHRHRAGRVAGLDFTQVSVEQLMQRFPDDLIVRADLSVVPLPLPDDARFDVISAIDVLLHILDADGFERSIANLAHRCAPGGWVIAADPLISGRGYVPAAIYGTHNVVRTVDDYRQSLAAHGFVVRSVLPAMVLLNTPLEATSERAYKRLVRWWTLYQRLQRYRPLAYPVELAAYAADHFACRTDGDGASPAEKIIFAQKQS